jgi:hypothetical protein
MKLPSGEYTFDCLECRGTKLLEFIQPNGEILKEECYACSGSGEIRVDEDEAAEFIEAGHLPLASTGTWSANNNHGFADEVDYIKSLKKDDHYVFRYTFEFILKNFANGNHEIDTAEMIVNVDWSEPENGYKVVYSIPEMHKIDPLEGNPDEAGFFEDIYTQLISDLDSLGVGMELRTF